MSSRLSVTVTGVNGMRVNVANVNNIVMGLSGNPQLKALTVQIPEKILRLIYDSMERKCDLQN
jgi:hypothetical protein